MDATDMINRCYRYQNPDAFEGQRVDYPTVMDLDPVRPTTFYASDEGYVSMAPVLPVEAMGDPDAIPIDGIVQPAYESYSG